MFGRMTSSHDHSLAYQKQGDLIFSDPVEGVVVIPQEKLHALIELIPKLVRADEGVKKDVEAGMTVKEAFAKHRSGL